MSIFQQKSQSFPSYRLLTSCLFQDYKNEASFSKEKSRAYFKTGPDLHLMSNMTIKLFIYNL